MIGQQKRMLEDIASSQPVKYQKHSDDKLSEAHTRVASLTDDKHELEQHLSGVSQKNAFSVTPGASCESMKVFERVHASELQRVPKKDEILASGGALDWSPSDEYELVRIAENPCSESAKESTVDIHGEDRGHLLDRAKKTQAVGSLGGGADFPPLSGSGPSTCDKNGMNSWSPPGSPSRDLTVELFRDQPIGLIKAPQGPSITKVNARQETINSRSLPVVLSEKVIDLYVMDEQVQSYGGYEIVTSEGLWSNISELLGLGSDCGPGLKLIYFKYLRQLKRGRERGPLLERHHDSDLIDDVHIRELGLPNENGLTDDKGESYSLTESEQFAESEPFHEKSGEGQIVNGKSSNVPLEVEDSEDDVEDSEDEAEILSVKRDGDPGKPHSQYRTDSYPFIGSCSFSQECQEFPETFLSNHHRLFKGYIDHHHGTGGPANKQKRELGTNLEDQRVVYDVAKIERFKKSLADTLMWIKRIAVEPGNPQIGQGPEGSGQNEKWAADRASQAQKIRALLWRRREDVRWGDGHSHQAKQQIAPPSIYYEDPSRQEQQTPERPRATRETRERAAHHGSTSAQKPFNESANFQRSPSPSSNQQPHWAGQTSQRLSRQTHHYLNEERYPEELQDRPRRRVPVGDDFQVRVPSSKLLDRHRSVAATGIAGPSGDETQSSDGNNDKDDSRWLGKQVWPPPGTKKFAFRDDFLARSRPSFCSCHDPESMSCARLHIEEERDLLRQELGQAFYIWKFDQMGESVADEWTKDEQHTFQTLVKMNPPSRDRNFWDQLREAFPEKKVKDLVSYYFNVFVLRRRAMQNRLNSQHVDSDDDETHYPDCESEDSDDDETHYPDCVDEDESGDEEEYQDGSEDEDESEKEEDCPYGSDSSAKLVEDTGLCELGGYSSKLGPISPLDEAQGVTLTVRTARLMNLQDVGHGYHDPHQADEMDVRLRTAHMSPKWIHHQRHDDENHLEEDHISIVGEEELQEVKTWEASHWDEADHDDLGHDPVPKGMSSKGEQTPERDPSLHKKAVDGTHLQTSTVGSGEGEVWGPAMDMAPINKRDKLLSTKGMIQEFFGNESPGVNASN